MNGFCLRFPKHTQMLKYVQAYAAHFKLEKYIRVNSEVTSVEKEKELWRVKILNKSDEVTLSAKSNGKTFPLSRATETSIYRITFIRNALETSDLGASNGGSNLFFRSFGADLGHPKNDDFSTFALPKYAQNFEILISGKFGTNF